MLNLTPFFLTICFFLLGVNFLLFLPLACIFTPHTLSSKYHSDTFHTIWYHPYMGGKKGYTARMAPSVVVVVVG